MPVVVPPLELDVVVVCAKALAVITRLARPMAILIFIFAHPIVIMLIFIALKQRISEHKKAPFGASASYEF